MKKPTHYRVEKVQKFVDMLKKRRDTFSIMYDPVIQARISELEYVVAELEKEFSLREELQ